MKKKKKVNKKVAAKHLLSYLEDAHRDASISEATYMELKKISLKYLKKRGK